MRARRRRVMTPFEKTVFYPPLFFFFSFFLSFSAFIPQKRKRARSYKNDACNCVSDAFKTRSDPLDAICANNVTNSRSGIARIDELHEVRAETTARRKSARSYGIACGERVAFAESPHVLRTVVAVCTVQVPGHRSICEHELRGGTHMARKYCPTKLRNVRDTIDSQRRYLKVATGDCERH